MVVVSRVHSGDFEGSCPSARVKRECTNSAGTFITGSAFHHQKSAGPSSNPELV